jgi:integrase
VSNSSPKLESQRPQLKLFSGGNGSGGDDGGNTTSPAPEGLSPHLTLNQFFEAYVLPQRLAEAKPRNIVQYRESLRYWARFTLDPPLVQINAETCLLFQAGLLTVLAKGTGKPLADNTRRKHTFHVQHCLDLAGPSHDDDEWQSLFGWACKACRPRVVRAAPGYCPTCDLPLAERKRPLIPKPSLVINDVNDNFTVTEIGLWLDQCHRAIAPRVAGLTPGLYHHSLVIVGYNTGLRIETLNKLEFSWLAQDDFGWWLNVPGAAIKKHRGRAFHVNPWALAAIERVRPVAEWDARKKIFPWPHTEGWLHEQRRRILLATAIPANRRFGFHGLRKACGTELSAINAVAAKMQLGHSGGDVTVDHYTHRRVLVEAHGRLPQPPLSAPIPGRDKQPGLF